MLDKLKKPSILFALIAIGFLIGEFDRIGDFKIFLMASEAWSLGENIYTRGYVHGFGYYYSPLFAILIHPLTYLPEHVAGLCWNALSFLMLWRSLQIIMDMLNVEPALRNRLLFLGTLAFIFPIYENFHMTQMSAFMLYAMLEGVHQISSNKRNVLGAAIIALAINIKLLPLVLIPYLIFRTRYRAGALVLVFVGLSLLAPALFTGWENNLELHRAWFKKIDPSTEQNIIDLAEPEFHSVTSFLSALFTDQRNEYELSYRRHLTVLPIDTLKLIIQLTRLLLVAFTLYFLRWIPFKQAPNNKHRLWELAYLCAVIPLIFPHQQVYGFYLCLPAAIYLVHQLISSKTESQKQRTIQVLALSAFFIINLELVAGFLREHLWYLKSLTYGTFVLILALALAVPRENPLAIKDSNN